MGFNGLSHCLAIFILSWHSQLSRSVEICCCPDLMVSLSAEESASTKKIQNGFMYVAKKDSTVILNCALADKTHAAIKSVVYKFHKTYDLDTSKPIVIDTSKHMELCADDSSVSTCDVENVQYSDDPTQQSSMQNAANHVYQCYVEVTLRDDAVIKLFSNTIKLDVHYPPTKDNRPVPLDPKSITIGKGMEKLLCDLPESSPKTRPLWSFNKKDTATYEVIDIPNDVRGDRLIIAEEKISTASEDEIEPGNLLIMIFNEDEDQGNYKCEAVYESVFGDTNMKFDISKYEVKSNGQKDSSELLLRSVSEITKPHLVNQDSTVSFTVYIRDAPGRIDFGDVSYTWQIKTSVDFVDLSVDNYPHLKLTNFGRTLAVSNLVEHSDHEFRCKVLLTKPDSSVETITVTDLGPSETAVLIAPKVLSIPLTSRTCVNHGDNLKVEPNKDYMMADASRAGKTPQQILLKADSYNFFLNGQKIMFTEEDKNNFESAEEAGVTQKELESKLSGDNSEEIGKTRCVYWQYMRSYVKQYQLFELMKMERFLNDGLTKVDLKTLCDTSEVEKDEVNMKVILKFPAQTVSSTAQCLRADLVYNGFDVLLSKELTPAFAESCATSALSASVDFTDIPEDKMKDSGNLQIRFTSESCGGSEVVTCSKPIDAKSHSKESDSVSLLVWAIILISQSSVWV